MTQGLLGALLAGILAAGPVAAENESAKDAFRQTEKGMGRLLEAMGQEVKKLTAGDKKGEAKKSASRKEKDKK